jgi:hypothetical protein
MPVCGCAQQLAGAPPILSGGVGDDLGIIVSGDALNPVVTAVDALAWRPMTMGAAIGQFQIVNFTLGNGTYSARYLRVGYTVDLIMSFKFGSTSTWSAAQFAVTLPWTPRLGANSITVGHEGLGRWSVFDTSASVYLDGGVIPIAGGNIAFRFGDDLAGTNTTVQQGTPITFATGDELSFLVRFDSNNN